MKKTLTILLMLSGVFAAAAQAQQTDTLRLPKDDTITVTAVRFPSLDSLTVTGWEFKGKTSDPWILLCHQARYSKGEYLETGPQLAKLGYNCLAIDQRSGKIANGIENETAEAAEKAKKETGFADAEQDIVAALNYIYAATKKPVILVGSSYSAALVLKVAATYPEKVKSVISFSPGEYFTGKFKIADYCKKLTMPVFMTSSRNESSDLKNLFNTVPGKNKTIFIPASEGKHGSKAIWPVSECRQEYWDALIDFLRGC
ncbi:MAG: hypothetical protein FD123_4193 [Bacteroidetes bacterium]|nr:MAG: hypothetical protein FD123_4193 [Bacteroidota bacterium]